MYNLAKYLGLETYIYSDEEIYNYLLLDIKKKLKPTKTLKKVFYTPTKNEIENKHFMIHIKNKPKIDVLELIECKKNLNKIH